MSITALEMNLLRRQNLGDELRRAALATPNKPAIIYYTTDGASRSVTYAELNSMANAVAHNLTQRGIAKGDKVAALSRNSIEFLVLGYALHRRLAGADQLHAAAARRAAPDRLF